MQQQASNKQSNILKNIDFVAWQFRHAYKLSRETRINRLISSCQHDEKSIN